MNYSDEKKTAILKKILANKPSNMREFAKQEGISVSTIYCWRKEAIKKGQIMPVKTSSSDNWPAEKKLSTVIATAAMTESELSQYCRETGLFPEQIQRWKRDCLSGFSSQAVIKKEHHKQVREDKLKIKKLEKELRFKDKALAETAALLVLRKKLNALWENENEDN